MDKKKVCFIKRFFGKKPTVLLLQSATSFSCFQKALKIEIYRAAFELVVTSSKNIVLKKNAFEVLHSSSRALENSMLILN